MNNITYSVEQVATKYDLTPRAIIYHIEENNLTSTLIDGSHEISANAVDKFEEYLYNGKLANRQKAHKLSSADFQVLVDLVEDIKSNIDYTEFLIKYGNLNIQFPSLKAIIKFKRDEALKQDKKDGMRNDALQTKYNLSKCGLENIIYSKANKEIL